MTFANTGMDLPDTLSDFSQFVHDVIGAGITTIASSLGNENTADIVINITDDDVINGLMIGGTNNPEWLTIENGAAAAHLSLSSPSAFSPVVAAPFKSIGINNNNNNNNNNNHNSSMTSMEKSANISEVTKFFSLTVKALYSYAVPIICVLGIVGDIISFSVFVFTSFRYQPCSQYLAALSLVDTMFLISQLISSLLNFFPVLALAPGSCSVMVFLSYTCSFLSAWFVVLMMIERYVVVCHPFRDSLIGSRQKAMILIAILSAFAILAYSHSFFTTDSMSGHHCQVDKEFYHFLLIFTYVDSFLTFVIPFLLIVVLNLRIIFTVRKFRLRHSLIHRSIYRTQRYHNADKTLSLAQVRSTKMLLRVSSVFVILYMPSYATRLYGMLLQQFGGDGIEPDTELKLFIAQQLCNVLYYVNFAVDFLVFSVTSSNFRRHVARCFRSKAIGCKYRYC